MADLLLLTRDFLKDNAIAIIITSILISLIVCYIIIFDIKFKKPKYKKKRTIVIE